MQSVETDVPDAKIELTLAMIMAGVDELSCRYLDLQDGSYSRR